MLARCFLLMLFTTFAAGCGKSPEADKSESKTPAIEKSPPEKTQSRRKQKPPKNPRSADAAVQAVFSGIRNNQPEALWAFLPASYQADVNGLFRLLAAKMDRQLWERTFKVGLRVVKLCRERRDPILDAGVIRPAAGTDLKTLNNEWNAVVALAGTLLSSDLASLKLMREFDGGEFLKSTGGRFMQQLARFSKLLPGDSFQANQNDLASLEAKLESEKGNTAVVLIGFKDEALPPKRVPFVRVEGKWIPKNLADGWKADITTLRQRIERELAPDLLAAKKKQFFRFLDAVEKSLDQLEGAKSPAEFQKRFENSIVAGLVYSSFRQATGRGAPVASVVPKNGGKKAKPGKARVITVIVKSPLKRDVAEKVADRLFDLAADADVGSPIIGQQETRFRVTTAAAFEAYRSSIKFSTVVSANAKKGEIVIRLK